MLKLEVRLLFLIFVAVPFASRAANVTWSGVDTTWSQPDADSFDSAYVSGDHVFFGNTGVGTVTLSGALTPGNLSFSHSTGTYLFNFVAGNTIASSGDLSLSGGGTVQFGNLTNAPGAGLSALFSWTGNTTISGGSTLAVTRPGTLGGAGTTVVINNGTLRMGADNTSTNTVSNNFSIGSGGALINAVYTSNQSNFVMSGNFTGGASAVLRLQASPSGAPFGNSGLVISGADNSGFSGTVQINGPAALTSVGMTYFASQNSLFSGASQVSVTNGGVLGVEFAVTDAHLTNVNTGVRGGLSARGAGGSLTSLANVMDYVGKGGALILDNLVALNNNRIADTSAITLDSTRFVIVGRNANTTATNEVIQSLSFTGGSVLNLDETNTNSSGVDLTTTSFTVSGTAGNSLLLQTDAGKFGTGAANSTLVVTGSGANKPTVTNGMISASVQQYGSGNTNGDFVTFSGDELITATAGYTNYAADWAGAASTEIVNLTAATVLSGSGTLSVHALRNAGAFNQNLGGRTISIGGGGLILGTGGTWSNGTLDFGAAPGFIGGYNAAAQISITAALSGSQGITFLGTSQSFDLSGSNNFTGGLFINGGRVTLNTASAANSNNVTVNGFGELNTAVSATTGAVIGGLSGQGRVSSDFQSTGNRYLAITPLSGNHSFQGTLTNGAAGTTLNILKEGSGTQIFDSESSGTYTGTTQVNTGTLLVNGDFASATGAVTVASVGRLGGTGVMGGALTTAGPTSRIAPGASAGRLTLNNAANFSLGAIVEIELGSAVTAGTTYDQLSVGGLFTGSTNAGDLNFEFTALSGFQTGVAYTILTFGSVSGLDYTDLEATILPGGYQLDAGFGTSGWLINGNNLQVQFSAIPEPSTTLLAAFGLTMILAVRRRK